MQKLTSLKLDFICLAAVPFLVLGACAPEASTKISSSNTSTAGANSLSAVDLAKIQGISITGSSQQYGIATSGTASVKVVPDLGILDLTVQSSAAKVAPAKEEAARAMTAVLMVLKDRGIVDKDIQTQNFNIQPVYDYNRRPIPGGSSQPVIVGYTVSNGLSVKIRKIDDMGVIIDVVVAAGGESIRVGYIRFTIDDPKRYEAQVRDLALKDAMAKAEQMAKVTGVALGKPVFISESGGYPIYQQREPARTMSGASAGDASTLINPGESEISMTVSMIFNIV